MELDRLTEQETQTAMDAIAKIIPVLDLQHCLQIVQWASERAAVINQPSLALVSESPDLPTVDLSLDEDESLPTALELSELPVPELPMPELSVVPPLTEAPGPDRFSVPTLELVGEPPEDLPLAI